MADINSILSSIIHAANEVTDMNDATVTNAVQSLMDGYGQGGGLEFLKFGMLDNQSKGAENTNYTITTISDLGFDPQHIVLFRASASTANGVIHVTDLHKCGDSFVRKIWRWYSNAWANQNITTALTEHPSGAIWLDGDIIKVNSTTNFNFQRGIYYWVAIGTPNI